MSDLIPVIVSADPALRHRSLDAFAGTASREVLLAECDALECFRPSSNNLLHRVRALFFLYAIHRFHLPLKEGVAPSGPIPFRGHQHLLSRRFEEAIRTFLEAQGCSGPNQSISSALAAAYRSLAFQTLADQVRRSVKDVPGNRWMFRTGHPADYPLRIRPELLRAEPLFPLLRETTPVRMDLSHSAWSDIFYLGLDFPEGARVFNTSIDLSLGALPPQPPVEAWLRVIDQPVLRLVSADLHAVAEISALSEVFDFARDYLGLLKAAVIASGLVPPGLEGSGHSLPALLECLTGRAGHGIEIVSKVNDIPKGSRLAVSTTLLAALIAVCMRATGQTHALTGPLEENDRRLIAARAILGEWLGGSGGGWQDSGGVWPGMKLISGVSGDLLPRHRIFGAGEDIILHHDAPPPFRTLSSSSTAAWPRMSAPSSKWSPKSTYYAARTSGPPAGRHPTPRRSCRRPPRRRHPSHRRADRTKFLSPIQTIIPWASNLFTETLIRRVRAEFAESFYGFWMLGGMSGGGMGFLFDPAAKSRALDVPPRDPPRDQTANSRAAWPSPWIRSSITSPLTNAARRPNC